MALVSPSARVGARSSAKCWSSSERPARPISKRSWAHHGSRRRREVPIDNALRTRTEEAIRAVRHLLRQDRLPPAVNDARCDNCSLRGSCLPGVVADPARVGAARHALFLVTETDSAEAPA